MKTFQELRKIALPYSGIQKGVPSNPFILCDALRIPYEMYNTNQSKRQIMYDAPAFLELTSSPRIYVRRESKYWQFYMFHEISHYLLGHTSDGEDEEREADMLACCLIAPVEHLPSYLKTAIDLNTLCQIPIDRAEEYWDLIYKDIRHDYISAAVNDYLLDIHACVNKLLSRVEILLNK